MFKQTPSRTLSYVVFALLYTLAYRLTSNAYYQIVSGARED